MKKDCWVPSNQPPNDDRIVLVWDIRGSLTDKGHEPAARLGHYIHALGCWRQLGGHGNFNDEITHWQDLPKGPK